MEQSRYRLMVTAAVVTAVFSAISVKLVAATVFVPAGEPRQHHALEVDGTTTNRADILDRNGNLLATSPGHPVALRRSQAGLAAGGSRAQAGLRPARAGLQGRLRQAQRRQALRLAQA
ncbi:hypothetical protein ACIU1J_06570 [Azospirillum doebereinerae]|uniref:hypothetical protein n=1 Tax=Azospirillum doebereinerae TaxID=92933 RepID=UPI00384CAE85